jgi:hypothetical protein
MDGTYEHFIYGPAPQPLERVGAVLTARGYLVPGPPRVSAGCEQRGCTGCRDHWLVLVYGSLEQALTSGGRDDILTACQQQGARYDGGGTLYPSQPESPGEP